jgi:hypothetical protein
MIIEEYFRKHSLKEEVARQFGWTWNENVITILFMIQTVAFFIIDIDI